MSSSAASMPDLVGGHVALDLVNTISWRLDPARARDNLRDAPALADWLRRTGLLDRGSGARVLAASPTSLDRALADVRALREQLHELLTPVVDDGRALDALVVPPALRDRLTDAIRRSQLSGSPMRWRVEVEKPADLPRLLALQVLDLLESADLHLLRRCDGDGCGWVFLDGSRSHTRRWCSSVDCGNRERARRHYARHRRAGADAPT